MNCDLTIAIDRFIGVDYGQRRIAWTVMDEIGVIESMNELVLPLHHDDNCHLCQLGAMGDYVDGQLTDRWVNARTLVAVELPIMVANNNVQTKLAMVAGMVIASVTRATDKHILVPPSTWKKALTDHGDATKDDVMQAVKERYLHLGTSEWPVSQDQADSIGIARWAMQHWYDAVHMPVDA